MAYQYFDPKDLHEIAWVKRVFEYSALIPGFAEKIAKDPEGVIREYGFPLTVEDLSFYEPVLERNHLKLQPMHPESAGGKYAQFMEKKFKSRDCLVDMGAPDNEIMKKWRARQIGRCNVVLGAKAASLIHTPFTIELADGCSVGCKFCGLNAGKLKGVFRCTEENEKLFREICTHALNIIGKGAGRGTLYFASEPMDNPDYEKFLAIYREIFGNTPQITTARSVSSIERLRPMLHEINETQDVIYRFSALSQEIVLKLFEEFTPEELILTEILPQYDEAPSSCFANVGREAEATEEYGDTISCVSGFVVNMFTHKMRLTTPTWGDSEHPTGEIILDERVFADADDFAEKLNDMIKKNMINILGPNDRIKLRDGISMSVKDGKIVFSTTRGMEFRVEIKNEENDIPFYKTLFEILSKGYNTKREVVAELTKDKEGIVVTDLLYYLLNKWWGLGLIEAESGMI